MNGEMDEDEADDEEVIDVAEQIFLRMAQAMVEQNRSSIREVFQEYIFEAEANGEVIELLEPMGLLDGIKDLGIDDLTEKEIQYLVRVLGKPELESAIIVDEFLQILENIGMYDDQPPMDGEMDDEELREVQARQA